MLPLFLSVLMIALAVALFRYDLLALTTAGVVERILNDVYDAVLLLNTDGMVLDTNVPHRYTAPNLTHFIPDAKDIPGWLQSHMDGRDLLFETRFAFESSRTAPAATRLRAIKGAGGALSGYILTAHDLSAEKDLALEVERRVSLVAATRSIEANFTKAFRLSPAGMLILERSTWVVLDANDAVSRVFCLSAQKIVGNRFTDLGIQISDADLEPFITAIQNERNCITREVQCTCPNGNRFVCLISAAPLEFGGKSAVLFTLVDSTELNWLRDSLARTQKLESIGILAGGLAHDFNNIMTAVMGNISLIKMNLDEKDDTYQSALHAEAACLRARDLSHQLLTFSKGGEPNVEPVDIPLLVKEAIGMATAGSSVSFHLSLEGNISPGFVDRGQIFQCFSNIALNAVQAMSQGGTLDVSIRERSIDKRASSEWPEIPGDLEKGDYIIVEFKDRGSGIPEENLRKIFDPYFSTKPKGSGLGLSIAYSILKRHHGGIGVLSQVGVGSRFFLYIPVAKDRLTNPAPVAIRMGKGEVLVMDDEYLIRLVVSQMLSRLGYEPTVCANGEAALEIFNAHRREGRFFRAVILDLTIADGMGGVETALRLREVDPSIVLFVSSGYSDDPIMSDYKKYGFDRVISKPFGIEELSLRLSGGIG
jgi:signal transduction histidine kinase/CheY-like chemotaxis protein